LKKEQFKCHHAFYNFASGGTFETGRNTRNSTSATSRTKVIDLTFSSDQFQTPRVIGGIASFAIPVTCSITTTASNCLTDCVITVKKNSTSLVSVTSATVTHNSNEQLTYSVNATIPKTIFAVGDVLNIQVEVYSYLSAAGNTVGVMLCHDPSGYIVPIDTGGSPALLEILARDVGETILKAYIPFRILQ
jgi:hypothetical protein